MALFGGQRQTPPEGESASQARPPRHIFTSFWRLCLTFFNAEKWELHEEELRDRKKAGRLFCEYLAIVSLVMGLVLLHNLMLYPNFINKQVQLRIRGRLYQFGLENSTFHPYWSKEKQLFTADNPMVKISYYSNSKGYFLTVFNPTSAEQKLKISKEGGKWKGTLYLGHLDSETSFDSETLLRIPPYLPAFVTIPSK